MRTGLWAEAAPHPEGSGELGKSCSIFLSCFEVGSHPARGGWMRPLGNLMGLCGSCGGMRSCWGAWGGFERTFSLLCWDGPAAAGLQCHSSFSFCFSCFVEPPGTESAAGETPPAPGAVQGHFSGKSLPGCHQSLGKGWGKQGLCFCRHPTPPCLSVPPSGASTTSGSTWLCLPPSWATSASASRWFIPPPSSLPWRRIPALRSGWTSTRRPGSG